MEITEPQKRIIVLAITAVLLALICWLTYIFVGVAVNVFVAIAPWVIVGAGVMYALYKYQESKNG